MKIDPNLHPKPTQGASKSGQVRTPHGLSGAEAAANAAAMIEANEASRSGGAAGTTNSLLGPLVGEQTANTSTFTGNTPFASSTLELGAGAATVNLSEGFLSETSFKLNGAAANTEVGVALSVATSKMEERQIATGLQMTQAAQNLAENNPQVRMLVAQIVVQNTPGKKPTEEGADVNGKDGLVFDLTTAVQNGATNGGLDMTTMSPEDAMVYMMMVLAKDARGDLNDMLQEMQATRKKKDALRQAKDLLKQEQARIKDDLRTKYEALPDDQKKTTSFDDYCASAKITVPTVNLDLTQGTASLDKETPAGAQTGDNIESLTGGSNKFGDVQAMLDTLGTKSDSLSDLTQDQQMRMQMKLDALTKAEQMASNISKKLSDTLSQIISNSK